MISQRIRVLVSGWRTGNPNQRRPAGLYLGKVEYAQLQAHARDWMNFFIPDSADVARSEDLRFEYGEIPVYEVNAEHHLATA